MVLMGGILGCQSGKCDLMGPQTDKEQNTKLAQTEINLSHNILPIL